MVRKYYFIKTTIFERGQNPFTDHLKTNYFQELDHGSRSGLIFNKTQLVINIVFCTILVTMALVSHNSM